MESLKRYVRLAGGSWWQFGVGVVAAVLGLVTDIWTDLEFSIALWVVLGVVTLVAAQFNAFRRLHLELSGKVVAAERELAELQAEATAPYQFAVQPLSVVFNIHTFRHPLESSQRGLAIRCVVGTVWAGPQLEVDSHVKTAVRRHLVGLSLEHLPLPRVNPESSQEWAFHDPTGEWVVTVARKGVDLPVVGLSGDVEVTLEVPFPGSRRGWIATIFDIAIRVTDGFATPLWDLRSFYLFADELVGVTNEIHKMSLSQLTLEAPRSVAGPVLALGAHSGNLDDFIAHPQWERARGASRASFLTIDAGAEDKATEPDLRRGFIADELRKLLAREGYVEFESDLQMLLRAR